jgi:uncharacterized LabA/DUF88 family protein
VPFFLEEILKSMLFVDGAYLEKCTFSPSCKYRIDFNKMIEYISKDNKTDDIVRTYYYYAMPYIGKIPTPEEKIKQSSKEKFINYLKGIPKFELRKGKVQKIDSTFIQKQVDVLFSIDLVKMGLKRSIEKAIIIAGDSDFCPAIQSVKDEGIVIKLYYFKGSIHNEVLQMCDERSEITEKILLSFATKIS